MPLAPAPLPADRPRLGRRPALCLAALARPAARAVESTLDLINSY
ncbi:MULTISPECIES: hypothetical protein [unclassified Streptomyces]|nr:MULTISPECIES: hypothetical protein [unclassified Streptomyces]